MSFRNRLTIFFIVLVILPMIVVATVGFVLAADSEQGKTDARLYEAQRSATGLFERVPGPRRGRARARSGRTRACPAAIESGDRARSRSASTCSQTTRARSARS